MWRVGGVDTAGANAVKQKYGYDVGAGSATVDADGKLVGDKEGYVTLTATSKTDPTKKITVTIVVAKNVTAIRTPLKTLYFKKSGKAAFTPAVAFDGRDRDGKAWGYGQTAKVYRKVVSGADKVKVNAKTGKVTPKKTGTAKVTVKALNGKGVTIIVKVVKKAKKLTKAAFKKPPKSLAKGKTKILKLKLTTAKATNLKVTFKSSKPSVLKVDKAGKLWAVKKGKAKITVKAGGKSKTVIIKVK
jgi:uncharacterized protein YjdB